ELSILYHINTAMRSTVRLNRLLRIILTGVTIGGGLGFNRAILLMVNERAQSLKGILGVGPGSGEEAHEIWENKIQQQKTLVEMIVEVPDEEDYEESSFEKTARGIYLSHAPDPYVELLEYFKGLPLITLEYVFGHFSFLILVSISALSSVISTLPRA
ncbi:MAG: hypothetical protein HGA25_02925, partial [Clostridiales bacterium]|nr:hypothetical protein [Clostridiales bacterium]